MFGGCDFHENARWVGGRWLMGVGIPGGWYRVGGCYEDGRGARGTVPGSLTFGFQLCGGGFALMRGSLLSSRLTAMYGWAPGAQGRFQVDRAVAAGASDTSVDKSWTIKSSLWRQLARKKQNPTAKTGNDFFTQPYGQHLCY